MFRRYDEEIVYRGGGMRRSVLFMDLTRRTRWGEGPSELDPSFLYVSTILGPEQTAPIGNNRRSRGGMSGTPLWRRCCVSLVWFR
jgi:hypothetical protein